MEVEAVVLSDACAGIGIASRQGCVRLKHLEVKWFRVQERVSEKALRLRKHPTETNIVDLATKYLSKHRMEMVLTASNLVLINEGEGMMSTCDRSWVQNIVIDYEVKMFLLLISRVFSAWVTFSHSCFISLS